MAVVCGDERMTYAELSRRADRLAGGLIRWGVRPLDRVVVQLPNVPEFVVVVLALFRAGAIPVLALPGHRRSEISHLAGHSGAVAYIVMDHVRRIRLPGAGPGDPGRRRRLLVAGDAQEFTPLASLDAADVALPAVDPAEPALFLLSGGTTGQPKLIPRGHDDYGFVMRATAEAVGADRKFTYLAVNPVAHQAALACPGVFGTLLVGGTVVLTSSVRRTRCSP